MDTLTLEAEHEPTKEEVLAAIQTIEKSWPDIRDAGLPLAAIATLAKFARGTKPKTHTFEELRAYSKYSLRRETDILAADKVLACIGGRPGDVVGMNDSYRVYAAFAPDGVRYVDYSVTEDLV